MARKTPVKEEEDKEEVPQLDPDIGRKCRVQVLMDKWTQKLCLQSWEIKWLLVETLTPTTEGRSSAATMDAPSHYKTATIAFARSQVDLHEDPELEALVIHELLHVVFVPLANAYNDYFGNIGRVRELLANAEEEVVDSLAHAFYSLEAGGQPYYINAPNAASPNGNGKEQQ